MPRRACSTRSRAAAAAAWIRLFLIGQLGVVDDGGDVPAGRHAARRSHNGPWAAGPAPSGDTTSIDVLARTQPARDHLQQRVGSRPGDELLGATPSDTDSWSTSHASARARNRRSSASPSSTATAVSRTIAA